MTKLDKAKSVAPKIRPLGPQADDLVERLEVVLACLRGEITFGQAAVGLGIGTNTGATQSAVVPILRECVRRGLVTITINGQGRGAA